MRLPVLLLHIALLLVAGQAAALTPAEIDDHLARAQGTAEVQPAPRATDAEFLRRVSLDVRGVVPTIEKTIAFLVDERPDKRQRLIDEFLASPQRGEHWGVYCDKLLVGTMTEPGNRTFQRQLKEDFRKWVAEQFNANVPYDEFIADIVSASGTTDDMPQALPLGRWRRAPESMAGSISRVFLGADIQCAQCHDHKENPELTQQKFWEFASFFANTRVVPQRNDMGRNIPVIEVADVGVRWQFNVPDTSPTMTVQPAYLDGTRPNRRIVDGEGEEISLRELLQQGRRYRQTEGARAIADNGATPDNLTPQQLRAILRDTPRAHDTRRTELASMMVHGDREQVARNIVNRVWARFMGRGLMEPLDGWATPATPDHPELLEALTAELIASNMDIRHIERLILSTHAYQRSSAATESSARRPELFAHAATRPLSPDQLINSLARVTQSATLSGEGDRRAEQIRAQFEQQFNFTFDSDEMEWITIFDPSIPRALFFLNEPNINSAVSAQGQTFLAALATKTNDPADILDYIFLTTLSRYPDDGEREQLLPLLQRAANNRNDSLRLQEDLLWALLTSTEFITNH